MIFATLVCFVSDDDFCHTQKTEHVHKHEMTTIDPKRRILPHRTINKLALSTFAETMCTCVQRQLKIVLPVFHRRLSIDSVMKVGKTKKEESSKSLVSSNDLESVVEKLTSLIDGWTEDTFRSFPHLLLLSTHRTLFTTDVSKMLLISMINKFDNLLLQVLNQDTLAVLEKLVQLLVGLTVQFSLKAIDTSLMSSQIKRLEAMFEASYSRSKRDKELELCCPLVKFVPAALALDTKDFLLANVQVVIPPQVNLKLQLSEYKTDKIPALKDFISNTSHLYPILDFLTAVGVEVQVYTLGDKYGLESAVLDPYRQYLTLGGITYVMPRYEPSAMMLYFTAHQHQRILSCSYHSRLKMFFFHISDIALPEGDEHNSVAEASVVVQKWSITSVVRLRIVSSTSTLVVAPELLDQTSSSSMVF